MEGKKPMKDANGVSQGRKLRKPSKEVRKPRKEVKEGSQGNK